MDSQNNQNSSMHQSHPKLVKELTISSLLDTQKKEEEQKSDDLSPQNIAKKIESEVEIVVENPTDLPKSKDKKDDIKQSSIIRIFGNSKEVAFNKESVLKSMNLTMFKELKRKNDPTVKTLVMNSKIINNIGQKLLIKKEKYDILFEECKKKNIKYTDPDFPPVEASLAKNWSSLSPKQQINWKKFVWRRAEEIFGPNYDIFYQEIEPNDIRQGQLGDCYLLSSLSSLAERPFVVKKIFNPTEKNQYGLYSVWLNVNGSWENIIIDDYFPCVNEKGGPAFSKANGNELWVLILEKAYAKVFGSYQVIEGGNPAVALRDLTGAPYENRDEGTAEELWEYIRINDQAGIYKNNIFTNLFCVFRIYLNMLYEIYNDCGRSK